MKIKSTLLIFLISVQLFAGEVPASLALKGSALNESLAPIPMKLMENDTYELFTSLKTGDYAFEGDNSIATANITVTGEMVPYRIRVNYSGNQPVVSVEKITKVTMWAPWHGNTIAELAYVGNSSFQAKNLTYDQTYWGDSRYRIKVFTEGNEETYGVLNKYDGMPAVDLTKPYDDFDIDEIVRYATEKGVTLIGHHETGGNTPNYERQMDRAFQWYKEKGVDVVKTGYAGNFPYGYPHHGQYGVNHYQKVVETAAQHQIMINAHEPIKDTGIRRTWPNMMTREAARVMEWVAWTHGNSPEHEVILPFTRLLSGPVDYSPGIFDVMLEYSKKHPDHQSWHGLDDGNSRAQTTLAKQIANWVTLYSPIQMAADIIENYMDHPCFQFFRDFDADCEQSTALDGEPGEFIVMVRKAKGKYFLGASTNEDARTVNISLDFLEPGKSYNAVIYADGDNADWETNPLDYKIIKKVVTASESLDIVMAKGGGQAISFIPIQ